MSKFIHLQNHTNFSILEATTTIEELVSSAKEFDQPGIAVTDNGAMYGVFKLQQTAKKEGIKPIIGLDAYVAPDSRLDKSNRSGGRNYNRLVLIAKNNLGYKNLIKLCSRGFTEGFYYKPRIDNELLEQYKEGIICLSGNTASEITRYITNSNEKEAERVANYYHELFGDDFYLQVQNHGKQFDDKVCELIPQIAQKLGVKVVATNDTYYQKKEQAVAHNIYLYIRDGGREEIDVENLRFGSDQHYIKSTEEMSQLFADNPEFLDNTYEVFEKCDVTFEKKIYMPNFPIPEESPSNNAQEYLRELVYKGLDTRYDEITEEIKERADYELKVINDMEFPGYFLVVWDFIRAAREMEIRVGPGRGSAAGSLVAYALKITDVDPLKYDLLFERFLNPDRESMPDIDIDFADDKREQVIEYVKDVYGEESVAMIITFGTLSSKAVLSDVGRVLQIPFNDVKNITKKIPTIFGKVIALKKALKMPEIKKSINFEDPKIKTLIDNSLVLENRIRNVSVHPAGVIIAPSDLTDYVPIAVPKKAEESSVKIATQFPMKQMEDAGLLKMDFLGLKTLSIIENTLDMVKKNHNKEIDLDNIDLFDENVYKMFVDYNVTAIFQFESHGMQEWLDKLKPQSIDDLSAMNALYRPGPMDNIGEFIDRKYGRKTVAYLHKSMERALKSTYGIIVYQEQVMRLVQDVAGFSLSQADILRRGMSKKVASIMNNMKPEFLKGAKEKGIEENIANQIWDLILKFANYGFNKSHAVAYSYLAFQTAYLKSYFTAEFLAANMTSELDDQSKIVALIEDAKKFDISVHPPDINKSNVFFDVREGKIYFGLAAIKGVGISAVRTILEARNEKEFESFADFCQRVDDKVTNKKTLESLICSGSFDSIENSKRAALFEAVDMAIDFSKSFSDEEKASMDSLFLGVKGHKENEFKLPEVSEWSNKDRLKHEKDVLDFFISGHPLDDFIPLVKLFNKIKLSQAPGEVMSENITLCAYITGMQIRMIQDKRTKQSKPFAILTIEDFYGKSECLVFPEAYEKYREVIEKDKIVLIEGSLLNDDKKIKISASAVLDIDQAMKNYIGGYKLWLDLNDEAAEMKLLTLKNDFFDTNAVKKQINFNIFDNSNDYKNCYKTKSFKISVNQKTLSELQSLFDKRVELILEEGNGSE